MPDLPELKGRKPFGGHVLSHDFVEAALMRRGGWAVTMLPQLGGSYEETPPSLIELAGRDRRWCQGNLQHMKIVFARGPALGEPRAFDPGHHVLSRLALVALAAGGGIDALGGRAICRAQLFPRRLLALPGLAGIRSRPGARTFRVHRPSSSICRSSFGIILALRDRRLRQGCGGVSGLLRSLGVEVVLSALLSPIMMLIQSRFVADVFLGRDSGWNAQTRDDVGVSLAQAVRSHWLHTLAGIGAGVLAFSISWTTFAWFSPIVAGLVLSIPISWLSGRMGLGVAAYHSNIFRIPEERAPVSRTEQAETPDTVRRLEAAE